MPDRRSPRPIARRRDPLAGLRRRVAHVAGSAPAPVAQCMDLLLESLAAGLDLLDHPLALPRVPKGLSDWPGLLAFLAELRRRLDGAQADQARTACALPGRSLQEERFSALRREHMNCLLLAEIMIDLVEAGGVLHTSEDYLERCGEILLAELDADIAVCRLRRRRAGGAVWENVAVSTAGNRPTPIFVRDLLETQPGHPVTAAIRETPPRHFVISEIEPGRGPECGPYDCVPYAEGYRSRLALILRDARGAAFGMVMLYARESRYFQRFDCALLADCGRVASLVVGRLLALGRDALAKAAGGMAHVGNNVLATLENRADLVLGELEDLFGPDGDAAGAGRRELLAQVRAMSGDIARLARAITRLEQAVERPVLMHYVLGRDVLDLEPERNGEEEA